MAASERQEPGNVFPSMVEVHGHPARDGYIPLTISTSRGPIEARLYEAPEPLAGVVLVAGSHVAADDLYDHLAKALSQAGIAVLWATFRDPATGAETTHDVLAGCRVLLDLGVERLGLVGRADAGETVVRAAAWEPEAMAVVTLADASPVAETATLPKGCERLTLADGGPDALKPISAWLIGRLSP
jgi:dienelactone hydrolase